MAGDPLDYQAMVQRALQAVLREALTLAAEEGLPDGHHFYLSFRTGVPGVLLPGFLRERFPEELTIVLQNQFWDLDVDDTGFSVTLNFDATHHRVGAPWEAVTAFIDPEAEFALRFGSREEGTEKAAAGQEEGYAVPSSPATGARIVDIRRFRKKDGD